jgi:hypothetical protein
MRHIRHHNTGAPRKREPQHTTQTPTLTALPTVHASAEFCGHKEARALFGISRSHLYRLHDEGLIRSVSLRSRGRLRGRRLFEVASIRELLHSNLSQTPADANTSYGTTVEADRPAGAAHPNQPAR